MFHNAQAHRCEIHLTHGHDSLPLACRQFPRVSLVDPTGTSITLSHFCPTALALLTECDEPLRIVDDAPAFPPGGEYVGLDARDVLPPLLRPGMLMDWEAWREWERLAIDCFNREDAPATTIARLAIAVEQARRWTPTDGPLIDHLRAAFATAAAAETTPGVVLSKRLPVSFSSAQELRRLRYFLAAHAFGSWIAVLGGGLRTWLRSLETVLFLVDVGWDLRDIDLWLRHYADPALLARVWSAAETETDAARHTH